MFKKIIVFLAVFLLSVSAASARTTEGVEMPETLEIGEKTVALNGLGVRQIVSANYYVAGLYLREAMTDPQEIMEADEPMAIRLEMTERASEDTMKKAFLNGLKGATGNELDPIRDEIDSFMDCFTETMKEGDVFEFSYMPGEGTSVYRSGEKLDTIGGYEFKKAMFGIWLSDQPADKKLKDAMLAGEFQVAMDDIIKEEEQKEAEKQKAEQEEERKEEQEVALKEEKQQEEKAEEETGKAGEKEEPAEDKADEPADKAADGKESEAGAETRKTSVSRQEVTGESVYFDTNDSGLTGGAVKKLEKKLEWLKANSDSSVLIEVYCDPRGSEQYNMWLAERRGESVRNWLVENGIDSSRIELEILGSEALEDAGDQDLSKSRRAEFTIIE